MDATINYLQRDSGALKATVDLNRTEMNNSGYTEESYTAFTNNISELDEKETAQEKAVKDTEDKTILQNQTIAQAQGLISDVKAAAKSAYGDDARNLHMFNIGADIPKSVKNLVPLCSYMSELVEEKKADLLKNGLRQEKIDSLKAMPAKLKTADDEQEMAKKVQKTRTLERDKAARVLKAKVTKIRNFAKTCFSDKPEILIQFDPIPKGHGGGNGSDKNAPEPPKS